MRRGLFVLIMGLAMLPPAVPAAADDGPDSGVLAARADRLAALWRRDPIQITDAAPRAVPADAAARIRRAVARLREPVYVAVEPRLPPDVMPEDVLPLVHDRLGRPGVYVLLPASGSLGAARQYGTLPRPVPDRTLTTAALSLASDAGPVALVERFVDVALAADSGTRLRVTESPAPKSRVRKDLDAYEAGERRAARAERRSLVRGTAIGAVAMLALIAAGTVLARVRRGRPRRPATTLTKAPAKGGTKHGKSGRR
ncbi:hypothetical protein [Actinomadura atramentaria]|uniref:hypothetical protein n=1 Tax=Actinomadura atramentaria TaxID=1990 RepID=UPI000368E2CA|nr:hypothetical protein [Actinomadura atramentaria]